MLQEAGLDIKASSEEVKYLINYYLSGQDISIEPPGWTKTLSDIQTRLSWDINKQPFANISAQKCSDMVLEASWRKMVVFRYNTQNTYTDYGVCCRWAISGNW